MSQYGFLAASYDGLTGDVDYQGLADYIVRRFSAARCPVNTVLDLACGTGTLTWLLARRGYEMIGVDVSQEMLAQAMDKDAAGVVEPPMFLNQPMEKLDLYGNIDACVCCLDSVNYVTRPAALRRAFERVHLFLTPGGLFLFDIRTPQALAAMDGQICLDENRDIYCLWRGKYSQKTRICTYEMDIFRRAGACWHRGEETHRERAYSPAELVMMLREAGFRKIWQYGGRTNRKPREDDDRIFFVARKEGRFDG